jgi:hypothetical protein
MKGFGTATSVDPSSINDIAGCKLEWRELPGRVVKPRIMSWLTEHCSGVRLGVHNADYKTLLRGVVERVFLRKDDDGVYRRDPGPEPGLFESSLSDFRSKLFKIVKHVSPIRRD